MSKPRYTKPDANQSEIVEYLRCHGIKVEDMSGDGKRPDLLFLNKKRQTGWMEVKVPKKGEARFTHAQLMWIALSCWPVKIVNNKEDALAFAQTLEGAITVSEQYNLWGFLTAITDTSKLFTVDQVAAAMRGEE